MNELWPSSFRWFTRKSNERLHRFERVIKKIAFVGWLLIGLGVSGEGVFEGFQNRAEGQLQTFNAILLRDARLTAGTAKESAQGAADASSLARDEANRATASSSNALQLAQGARHEADSFATDIKSAKEQAAAAERDLADALRQAADAREQLNLLKAARLLTNASVFANTLRQFAGTQYTFSLVATDPDSVSLLRQIDSALQLAGWKRVKPSPEPAIGDTFNDLEKGFMVGIGTQIGVVVQVDSTESVESLRSRPSGPWPPLVRAAATLRNALATVITPVAGNVGKELVVLPGSSPVIRIAVGSKAINGNNQ